MKPLNILAIGNSFSHDAFVYLQKIFQSAGIAVKTVNLSIGGCSLETHWENAKADKRDYLYGLNGVETERLVSIREVLGEEKWDKIAFQQASHLSGLRESYFPHLAHLSGYIHEASPDAEQLVHQTWAYETDSEHPGFAVYENSQEKMYNALCKAYRHAASVLGARLIPAGEVIQRLRTTPEFDYSRGGRSLCRDGFHL
ncbi:MAG: DUF4886 domain-containing protein, partial [Oscillospiraceae bacterium]|nr:DUF4886 domain-containing protein [Oscillospiraceae bacterium]